MGFTKFFAASLLLSTPLASDLSPTPDPKSHERRVELSHPILYSLQKREWQTALNLYKIMKGEKGSHDLELVQEMGRVILEREFRSADPEMQFLALYGCGLSMRDDLYLLLEEGVSSSSPQMQLLCLNFLAKCDSDITQRALYKALSSPFAEIRVEALFHLVEKRDPKASYHLESLMQKLPPRALPIFAFLFAKAKDQPAKRWLQKLMRHQMEEVRCSAILASALEGRDELLPDIRSLLVQTHPAQQQAAAAALGLLQDSHSIAQLEKLSHSPISESSLAACVALCELGREEYGRRIAELAQAKNPYAISALSQVEEAKEALCALLGDRSPQVRFNAAAALLESLDARSLPTLAEFLLRGADDLSISRASSVSRALSHWRVAPPPPKGSDEWLASYELTNSIKRHLLEKCRRLPEGDFLALAEELFMRQCNHLVPTLVTLLEQLHTPKSLQLLARHAEQPGAPLVRYYCRLALYRVHERREDAEFLKAWIRENCAFCLVELQPLTAQSLAGQNRRFCQFSPEQASRYLLESIEALFLHRDDELADLLIEALLSGHPKNRPLLAGLLIRVANS